jgi:aspartate dehydrogenase
LREGRDVFVISVGGLLDHQEWFLQAETRGCRILVASGAITGLDGVRAATVGRIESVTMTTRKPPRGLAGAPYVVDHNIDLDALTEETPIFEGTAREACRGFPSNVNVSAALSLAGVGPDKTRVRIIAVPGAFNRHRIKSDGEFDRLVVEVELVASATDPRTACCPSLVHRDAGGRKDPAACRTLIHPQMNRFLRNLSRIITNLRVCGSTRSVSRQVPHSQ